MQSLVCSFLPPPHPTAPRPCSLEHCPRVSSQGLRRLAASLPLLSELRLFGSGVKPEEAGQLQRTPCGRRLRIGLHKTCWWMGRAPSSGTLAAL